MSLRIFHIVFIVAAFGLSLFVTLWGFREYMTTHSGGALALAIVFLVAAVVLIAYSFRAFAKLKELDQ